MSNRPKDTFLQLIQYKANRILRDEDYSSYRKGLMKELKINTTDEAFLVGALDAMIFDMAASTALGPAYMKSTARGRIIKEILSHNNNK